MHQRRQIFREQQRKHRWRTRCSLILAMSAGFLFPGFACAQGNVAIHATDQETDAPIEQVRMEVVIFPDSIAAMGFTDSSGMVELHGLKPRRYVLRASKEGYQNYQESLDLMEKIQTTSVSVRLHRIEKKAEIPGPGISARDLSIPAKARKEFLAGVELLGEKNNPKESINHFKQAVAEFPTYFEAHYMLGMAQLKIGDASGGEASLRKSVDINPRFLDPYYPLSELLIRQQHYQEAESLLQVPFQEDQESWKWPYELAMCYDKLEQWAKGLSLCQIALARKDAPSKVRLLLADLYENNGETAKAIIELETFKKQDPQSPMIPKVNQVLEELHKKTEVKKSSLLFDEYLAGGLRIIA